MVGTGRASSACGRHHHHPEVRKWGGQRVSHNGRRFRIRRHSQSRRSTFGIVAEPTSTIWARVEKARSRRKARFAGDARPNRAVSADMGPADVQEDCGGPYGYQDFLDALKGPKQPEHESYTEWIGGRFNAEAFDVKKANSRIRLRRQFI